MYVWKYLSIYLSSSSNLYSLKTYIPYNMHLIKLIHSLFNYKFMNLVESGSSTASDISCSQAELMYKMKLQGYKIPYGRQKRTTSWGDWKKSPTLGDFPCFYNNSKKLRIFRKEGDDMWMIKPSLDNEICEKGISQKACRNNRKASPPVYRLWGASRPPKSLPQKPYA